MYHYIGALFRKGSGGFSDQYKLYLSDGFTMNPGEGFGSAVSVLDCSQQVFERMGQIPPDSIVELAVKQVPGWKPGTTNTFVQGVGEVKGKIADFDRSPNGFVKRAPAAAVR